MEWAKQVLLMLIFAFIIVAKDYLPYFQPLPSIATVRAKGRVYDVNEFLNSRDASAPIRFRTTDRTIWIMDKRGQVLKERDVMVKNFLSKWYRNAWFIYRKGVECL